MKWFQNILVGCLFFGSLAIVGYFTIISEDSPFASQGKHMVLFFENADGIKSGSKVTVLGVPHGTVVDVKLVAVDKFNRPVNNDAVERVGQKVAITIEMKQEITFYKNYKVAIKSESLLSDKLIAIDPGSAIAGKIKPGEKKVGKDEKVDKIPVFAVSQTELQNKNIKSALDYLLKEKKDTAHTTPDPDAAGVDSNRPNPRLVAYVDLEGESSGDPIAGISELIEENRENVRKTIENIASITGKINRGKGTVGRLINSPQLHQNANDLVKDAQVVVKELRETLEDTREQAPVTSFIRAVLTAF